MMPIAAPGWLELGRHLEMTLRITGAQYIEILRHLDSPPKLNFDSFLYCHDGGYALLTWNSLAAQGLDKKPEGSLHDLRDTQGELRMCG